MSGALYTAPQSNTCFAVPTYKCGAAAEYIALPQSSFTNLDAEFANVQLRQNFYCNFQTFRIWQHCVVLTSNVKVLQNVNK